uniref:Uncharacterized protein n=1 Tax=Schlesneria paludicola TaxID=360056 RepID=A0A7C4LMF3_9PLAN
MDWVAMVDRLGIPLTLLGGLAYAAWRSAAFFAPKITAVTEAHLQFVASVGQQTSRLAEQAEKQTALLESQHHLLKEQGRLLAEMHGRTPFPTPP